MCHITNHIITFKKKLKALCKQLNMSYFLELDKGGTETGNRSILSKFLILSSTRTETEIKICLPMPTRITEHKLADVQGNGKINMLKMSNSKENKELTPEPKAFEQHHLSHSPKYQPSHKMKFLISYQV